MGHVAERRWSHRAVDATLLGKVDIVDRKLAYRLQAFVVVSAVSKVSYEDYE